LEGGRRITWNLAKNLAPCSNGWREEEEGELEHEWKNRAKSKATLIEDLIAN
jgi:hypothetical protein